MTENAGWLSIAIPVLVFAVPPVLCAFLLEVVWPRLRGER